MYSPYAKASKLTPPLPKTFCENYMKRFGNSLSLASPKSSFAEAVKHLNLIANSTECDDLLADPAFTYLLAVLSARLGLDRMDETPELYTKVFDSCSLNSTPGSIEEFAVISTNGDANVSECISRLSDHFATSPLSIDPYDHSATKLILHTVACSCSVVRLDSTKLLNLRARCQSNATMEVLL